MFFSVGKNYLYMNCNIVNTPPPGFILKRRSASKGVKVVNLDSTTILISIDNEYY